MTIPSDEVILAVVIAAVFCAVAFVLYRVYEKRLAEIRRRVDETPSAAQTSVAIDSFKLKIDAFQQRLDHLTQTFQDYQQNTRTWLEKTLETIERRWGRAAGEEPAQDMERIRRFKNEMPRYEEKFVDLAEKNAEIAANLKRLSDQYKLLGEKLQNPGSEEEREECRRQLSALMVNLGRVLGNSSEILIDGEEAIRDFVGEMAPVFKVCDLCGEIHETLSICLNCGKKYCEICKGLQIGHCKECAPYYKPLHMEVNE